MNAENKVSDSNETLKEIISRLNNSNKRLCLYDYEDDSSIVIDNDLLIIIRKYYENKLIDKVNSLTEIRVV